jgi:hypothetical protein
MAKRKTGIEFKGFEELAENFQKLGGNINKIVEECLEVVPDVINPKLEQDMARHRRTGKVVDSVVKDARVTWEGSVAKMPVGFGLRKGGWASIYLMYGTARHAPANQYGRYGGAVRGVTQDKKLHDDIYGTTIKRKINEKQQEIFFREIKKRMEG